MIKVDLSRCTGCRQCETACAFYHTGRVGTDFSRIKVTHIYETGIDGPVVCIQCKERYCLKCPEEALTLGSMGQVLASPTLCQGCATCEIRCPTGAITLFEGIVYVCDLCGGDPWCVKVCNQGAIKYIPESSEEVSLRAIKKDSARKNPSEKRRQYVEKMGREIRKKWGTNLG